MTIESISARSFSSSTGIMSHKGSLSLVLPRVKCNAQATLRSRSTSLHRTNLGSRCLFILFHATPRMSVGGFGGDRELPTFDAYSLISDCVHDARDCFVSMILLIHKHDRVVSLG